jgi:Bacterial Ig-like domain
MRLLSIPKMAGTAIVLLPLLGFGCGGSDGNREMMTGPGNSSRGGTMLLSVTPTGGSVGVPVGSPMTFRFSGPMAPGAVAFMDLHHGGLDGPLVPMHCAFADPTTLTCTPGTPLHTRTNYMLHLGAGLQDFDGRPCDLDPYRGTTGGQWIMGSMMGGSHNGSPWGMMGGNWHGANGSYGMAFSFTTE